MLNVSKTEELPSKICSIRMCVLYSTPDIRSLGQPGRHLISAQYFRSNLLMLRR